MKFMRSFLVFACIALGFTACTKDDALPQVKEATLSGLNEVPANTSGGSGVVKYSYDPSSKTLSYTLNWQGLTGPATASHIHGGAYKGFTGPVIHDYATAFPKAVTGTYSGTVIIDGVVLKESDLYAGRYYFNIHTAANPGGELRAQIEF